MRGRRRVGHGHARAATVLVVAFGLVAGVLSVAATPAIVQAADPPPGPVPPGDCEWFGEATYDRTQVYDRTASKAKQTDVWHMDARSTPVTGTECGAEVNATYDMTFADEDTVTCDPPDADPYSTTITYRQRIEVAGSQDTASVTQLVADGAEGDTRINLTFPVDPFLGTRTYSIDGGCRATDPTVVDCTTDASAAGNGYCVFDPAIVFGPCQSSRTASAVPFYFPPTAQAVQGTCTLGFEDVQSTATLTVSDVRTWRLRRTVCDRSVDTDDGGVGDCDEFDNGTNPLDPLDDTEDPCDARFGGADADLDGVTDACDNCLTIRNPDQADSDRDGTADACEPLVAVDDELTDDFVTVIDGGMVLDVLLNDVGDDIEIVDSALVGHDVGAIDNTGGSELTWGFTSADSGIYRFSYTIEDRYGRQDTAVATVRVVCRSETETTQMRWTAEAVGADLYHLDADITYCPDDGQITDFTLTPSVARGANFALGLIGFEPRVNDVSYSPPRSTYPALTVAGATRFDLCFSPAALIGRFAGKQLDGQVTRAIEWVLNRNLRRSGEWTAASLRFGLQAARDDVLRAAVREIRRLPGLRGTAEDAIAELVEGTLREVLNKVIGEVLDAAGPAEVLGMTPDEAAVWAARELLGRIPSVCAPMRVWEPEVTIVGRPLQEPLQPSPPAGYTNPFITVRATTPGD